MHRTISTACAACVCTQNDKKIPGSRSAYRGYFLTSNRRFRAFLRTSILQARLRRRRFFCRSRRLTLGRHRRMFSQRRIGYCGSDGELHASLQWLAQALSNRDGCQSDAFCPSLPAPGGLTASLPDRGNATTLYAGDAACRPSVPKTSSLLITNLRQRVFAGVIPGGRSHPAATDRSSAPGRGGSDAFSAIAPDSPYLHHAYPGARR